MEKREVFNPFKLNVIFNGRILRNKNPMIFYKQIALDKNLDLEEVVSRSVTPDVGGCFTAQKTPAEGGIIIYNKTVIFGGKKKTLLKIFKYPGDEIPIGNILYKLSQKNKKIYDFLYSSSFPAYLPGFEEFKNVFKYTKHLEHFKKKFGVEVEGMEKSSREDLSLIPKPLPSGFIPDESKYDYLVSNGDGVSFTGYTGDYKYLLECDLREEIPKIIVYRLPPGGYKPTR